jgi:hypothetical protein
LSGVPAELVRLAGVFSLLALPRMKFPPVAAPAAVPAASSRNPAPTLIRMVTGRFMS